MVIADLLGRELHRESVVGKPPGLCLELAVANIAESWLAAWALVRYVGTPITLHRLKEVFGLAAVAATPACAVGAVLGALLISLTTDGVSFGDVWRVWMMADMLGLRLMSPLVIAWNTSGLLAMRILPRAVGRGDWAVGAVAGNHRARVATNSQFSIFAIHPAVFRRPVAVFGGHAVWFVGSF